MPLFLVNEMSTILINLIVIYLVQKPAEIHNSGAPNVKSVVRDSQVVNSTMNFLMMMVKKLTIYDACITVLVMH